ncbi:hypothetical protein BCR42DRAFT_438730 [Absidia repens]|uniref:Uncharacterized protein n=1 Tax=Absidia repens TaxID=90262 RepID=A0A1X2IE55_9FUNG|nr:hypothetical protein BCR42DRAFT_438730 [Absidia repens]
MIVIDAVYDQWSYIKSSRNDNATMAYEVHGVKKLFTLLLPLLIPRAIPFLSADAGVTKAIQINQDKASKQYQSTSCPSGDY